MDYDTYWTASALFSPSKARQQQAQAKDWSFVDAWLQRRYGTKSVPAFERNEDTLQALLALATLNESADEQRNLVHRIHKAALKDSDEKVNSSSDSSTYETLETALSDDGQKSLGTLANTHVLLETSGSEIEDLARKTIELTSLEFGLSQQVKHADELSSVLQSEHLRLRGLLDNFRDEAFQPSVELPQKTVEWSRGSKHLKAKVAEYNERLASLNSTPKPLIAIADVGEQEIAIGMLRQHVGVLEERISVYQELPSSPEQARDGLEKAKNELRDLIRKRDRAFEQLVDSGNREIDPRQSDLLI